MKRSQSSFLISLDHSITGLFVSLEAEAAALGGVIGASIATFWIGFSMTSCAFGITTSCVFAAGASCSLGAGASCTFGAGAFSIDGIISLSVTG